MRGAGESITSYEDGWVVVVVIVIEIVVVTSLTMIGKNPKKI